MGYKDPTTVVSPKNRWEFGKVLCSTGQGGWSIAEGRWEGTLTLGIRWNGDDDSGSPGNPQSHGNPTWFIVPEELQEAVRGVAYNLSEAIDFVSFKSERPEGFDYGVFKITITISGKVRDLLEGHNVTFELPTLPKRFFRHDDSKYMAPSNLDKGPRRGRFVDGQWQAIVQTNGISEEENPTSMNVVKDALIAQVVKVLQPWKLAEPRAL